MAGIFRNIGQVALIFAGLFAAQWVVPYFYLVPVAGGYGAFQVFSQGKKSGWNWVAAALIFGVNAWVFDHYFRK